MRTNYKKLRSIIFTGSESTGKTSACFLAANRYQLKSTTEYAREYLENKSHYKLEDLVVMARRQQSIIQDSRSKGEITFHDTDLITFLVWSKLRFKKIPSEIVDLFSPCKEDLYLLFYPDIPWQKDPLRENPNDREAVHQAYLDILSDYELNYEIIKGQGEIRINQVLTILKSYLQS